ncbi:MAG: TSUP family transporter [Beijerinckiaceae bacterium]|jgi:hypothetical protein|nr:TSUP family transporter [Beijerinckiaceae bacterium]
MLGPFSGLELGVSAFAAAGLVLAAFVAGFVDAIAGGGGLITVPALLLAGVSPVGAIATNKLQGTFGVASSALSFYRAGRIDRALVLPLFGAAFGGGIIGALIAHLAPTGFLRLVIPFLLVAIALYVAMSPRLGDTEARPRLSLATFTGTVGVGIGIYDGVFGPGAGTFYLIGLILLCGFGMMRAVAHTKMMNLASNLGALIFFLLAGHILIAVGLMMGAASATGAWLGVRASLRFGPRLVRPLVVIVALAMALRLMLDASHPIGAWLRGLGG